MKVPSKLIHKEYLTEDILLIRFNVTLDFKAGQFFNIWFEDDRDHMRSYSILNPTTDEYVASAVKIIPNGYASEILKKANVEDEFNIDGPYGIFMLQNNEIKEHVLVATGTGVTPFHSMLFEHVNKMPDHNFYLFFSAKTKSGLIFDKEFRDLEKTNKNFKYYPTVTQEAHERNGRIQLHIPEHIRDYNKNFYICGLKEFIQDIRNLLLEKGVEKKNIHIERYA